MTDEAGQHVRNILRLKRRDDRRAALANVPAHLRDKVKARVEADPRWKRKSK